MALIPVASLCTNVTSFGDTICISFPGGATICAQAGYEFGDPTEVIKNLFGQVNAGLAPLAPFFNVLDVAIKMFDCVKSVVDCLGPPPNPQKLVNCLPELEKAINLLLKLIPALSIPSMVKDFLNAVIAFLKGLKLTLQAMITKNLQIIAGQTRAATLGNLHLTTALDCAKGNLDAELNNLNIGLSPLNRLLGVINAFMQIADLGCVPQLGNIGALTGDVLTPIDAAIHVIENIRDAIPSIPAVAFGPPPGSGNC